MVRKRLVWVNRHLGVISLVAFLSLGVAVALTYQAQKSKVVTTTHASCVGSKRGHIAFRQLTEVVEHRNDLSPSDKRKLRAVKKYADTPSPICKVKP